MARHYYLTRSGRLRRKDNTLCFEPSAEAEPQNGAAKKSVIEELFSLGASPQDAPAAVEMPVDEMGEESRPEAPDHDNVADMLADDMGDLALEPEAVAGDETIAGQEAAAADAPVRVAERRVIPIEDVDALWAFG